MELSNLRTNSTTKRSHAMAGRMAASAEDYFPHGLVPILDDDLLEDDYFEPDGVNDFIRNHDSWDPDRES